MFVDIAHQLAAEILDRGEDSSADHIALDAGEPVLDLVQPRGVRRREVHLHIAMFGKDYDATPNNYYFDQNGCATLTGSATAQIFGQAP